MALTREQFDALRKQGLTVEQIAKFESGEKPQAKSTPAQSNMRESKPLRDTVTGLAKSAGRTVLGVGTLGRTVQKMLPEALQGVPGAGKESDPSVFDIGSAPRMQVDAALTPVSQAERTAGFVGDVATMAVPSASVQKAVTGVGMMSRLFARGTVGGLSGAIQGGGDIDSDAGIGAAVEVASPVVGVAARYGGNVLKGLAGLVTGKGSDVIEQVLKTPEAALEGGRASGTEGLKESARIIRQGVKTLLKQAGEQFEQLTKDHTEQLSKDNFTTLVDDFFAGVDEDNLIKPQGLDELKSVVAEWDDYSAQGINKLASKLSKFYKGTVANQDIDAIISRLNRTVRNWVGEQVPEIAQANRMYADKMDLIEQMDAIFRLRGSVDDRLGLQKTAESIGRLFNANKDLAREGVEELEKELGINVLGREAGRQLVDGVTRSQGAIGDAVTGVAKALVPPRLVLELIARTGMAKEVIESRLSTIAPAARGVVIEVLTDLFQTGDAR